MAAIIVLISPLIMTAAASGDYGEQIFNQNLRVGEGIEIERSVKIEVVDTTTDVIDSARLRISSYLVPVRMLTIFQGDMPTKYETYSGACIYLEVVSVRGETVLLMVTGPDNWRVTSYYEAEETETGSEPAAEAVTVPGLEIARTLDRNHVEHGQLVLVTFKIKNIGNGTATDIEMDEPLLRGAYQENCPTTLDDIAAGATTRISYDLKMVDTPPGTCQMDPVMLNYKSESGRSYSSESASNVLEITETEVQLPELEIEITIDPADRTAQTGPAGLAGLTGLADLTGPLDHGDSVIICGDRFPATVRIDNIGNATTSRVAIKSHLPDDVRVADGDLEPVYESIKPGDCEEYEVMLIAYEPGKHEIKMDMMWADEAASASVEFWAERSSLEKYYLHILAAVPIGLLLLGIIRRHREYSY